MEWKGFSSRESSSRQRKVNLFREPFGIPKVVPFPQFRALGEVMLSRNLEAFGIPVLCLPETREYVSPQNLARIYIPFETYVPVNWDGTDLMEKTEEYLPDDKKRMRIARNGWERYREELDKLPERTDRIVQRIMDL